MSLGDLKDIGDSSESRGYSEQVALLTETIDSKWVVWLSLVAFVSSALTVTLLNVARV
jgi:hypothetical protein